MGGSQSSRRLTLVNDDKGGIIKVSESLAHRLKGQIEDASSTQSVPSPDPPVTPPQATAAPPPAPTPQARVRSEGTNGWSGIPPEEAKRALGRLHQEQEEALAKLQEEWKQKMINREKEFVETSALIVSETEKAAQEVEKAFMKHQLLDGSCRAAESSVIDCYKQNPKQTLNCASAVKNMMRCIDLPRLDSIAAGGA